MSLEKVYHIRVDHIDITVVKKNMKHMNLSIRAPDGRVRIAAPHRVSDAAIFAFASSKLEWIQSRQKTFVYTPVPELEYISGETLRHFGQNLELQVIYSQMAPRVVYHASARRIEMHIWADAPRIKRENLWQNWQKNELGRLIPELITKWEPLMEVKVQDWNIRKMKTRWGTCNIRTKKIWINLELAKYPLHCLEYLVVHEMTHLLERLHSARFFGYMDRFLPEWRDFKHELNGGEPTKSE